MRNRQLGIFMTLCLTSIGSLYANNLVVQPMFSDKRFPPVNKLHAGCSNSFDVLLNTKDEVGEIRTEIDFNAEDVRISRIVPSIQLQNATVKVDNGKIIFYQSPIPEDFDMRMPLFSVFFSNTEDITKSTIKFVNSYVTTIEGNKENLDSSYTLNFAKVPECNPDIIPPKIELIYPKPNATNIPLDSYFTFKATDIGKSVDQQSVKIVINGEKFSYNTPGLSRSGDYVTVTPSNWLPVNQQISISIQIADRQKYGGANTQEKSFVATTSPGISFMEKITPSQVRQIFNKANTSVEEVPVQASSTECTLLQTMYEKADLYYQTKLQAIMEKLSCEVPTISATTSIIDDTQDAMIESGEEIHTVANIQDTTPNNGEDSQQQG